MIMAIQTVPMSRRIAIFAVVAWALFMSALDGTIVASALHVIQSDLHTSLTWVGWTITAYGLGIVAAVMLIGKIAERFGRRRMFLWSVAVFCGASLLCGVSQNIYMLIVFRVLQAIGGAGFAPTITGIIVDYFGASRDKFLGLFGGITTIGGIMGPIIGGIIVEYWSWRGVFLVNVPIGLVLIPLALHIIPRDKKRRRGRKEKLDYVGAGYLGVGLIGLMLGLTFLQQASSTTTWICTASFTIAFMSFVLFLQHIRRVRKPIVAPQLIYGRGFGVVNFVNVLYCGAIGGLMALVPLYAVMRYDMSTLNAATLLTVQAVGAIVFTAVGTTTLRKTGYRRPMMVGALLTIVGLVALSMAPIGDIPPYAWLAASAAIVGSGLGLGNPASRNAGLQLMPNHAPSIAALRAAFMQVGSITAVSLATVIIESAHNPSGAQSMIYAFMPLAMLLFLPLINKVPEHKGTW